MATVLTAKQKEVIRKIIYAVETGGQVYGKQDYSSFAGAGANTPNEVAITIGAGAWYATQAKKLLNLIRSKDKNTFNKLDTAGIGNDLDNANWSTYSISKTSNKAKCIVKIISSSIGVKCQDELMEQQITDYTVSIQKTYGNMTVDAIAECINVKHQGGEGALKRILAKTSKPYSAKSIKATLDLDPADKSNNNQVGDYTTRQAKVYNMIVTYLMPTIASSNTNTGNTNNGGKNTMTEAELRSKVANYMVPYIGVSEGSSGHLAILKTFNDSGLCSRYKMTRYDAWCATAASSAFIANGLAGKQGSGKLFECVECGCSRMINYAKAQGIWVEADNHVPKVGDLIMYVWSDSGYGENTNAPDHVGVVKSVSGNTFKVIEGNMGYGTVGYRTMTVNGRYIRGFITPNYAKFATGAVTENTTPAPTPSTPSGSTSSSGGGINKTCKFKGAITADGVNVRTWAGVENKSLRTLKKGTIVEVCDIIDDNSGDDWYYIKESNKYGFVSADYVSKEIESSSTSTSKGINKTCKFKGVVTADPDLNVRSWAGIEYDKLRALKEGTVVEVCDEVKDKKGEAWYYIKESNKYGFVSAKYISKQSASAGINKTCKFKGVVTASPSLNVRSWAGTEYNRLRSLNKGTTVEVCDEVKASTGKIWYYIKESGRYGFVTGEYIARI